MKIDDVKVGQILGATFPYHRTEPTKKHGYRVLMVEPGYIVRTQDVKTGEIDRWGFGPNELSNWHIVEDVP